MTKIFRAVAIVLGVAFSVAPAFSAEGDGATITLRDSLKDTEILLAKILKEKLNVNGTLTMQGDNLEDLVLRIRFDGKAELNQPDINVIVDTRVVARDSNGDATSQVISIASVANLTFSADKTREILEWTNKWNSRTVPLNLYLVNDRIVASYNILVTKEESITSGYFTLYFTNLVRSWPTLIKDMQETGILE